MFGYLLLFEPRTLFVLPSLIARIPRILRKRRIIMKRTRITADAIHRWFR
ncbi:MAG: hypothetical protein HY460_00295 [Parcubacteria group bacterium]|nr:hypothetical protein [Parcubacteria group bacterium]